KALREAVKPTKSLLPGESPGYDCERSAADFSQCKFFCDTVWNTHRKSKRGITTVGQVIGRRGRKPRGTNTDAHAFLENVDGAPAGAREYEVARQWAHDILDICIGLGVNLPGSWKDVDIRIRQLCY
ncbi:hypothetical protein OH76DRAFT_1299103, partial [Lentinus brumalis]